MPQVLPGSTGGSRLRARSGGMSVHVATSPAFPPVIVPSVRLGDAASQVRTPLLGSPVPPNSLPLLFGSGISRLCPSPRKEAGMSFWRGLPMALPVRRSEYPASQVTKDIVRPGAGESVQNQDKGS